MVIGTILIGRVEIPDNPMGLMFAYWSCVWLGAAFGLLICAIRRFMPMFEEWIMPLRRMGIFISGVIFTATTLPGWMLPYFSWNPLFRAIEIARESWHSGYSSPISDPGYVFLCAFGLTAVGIVAERITRRYAGE
jgi:ABC-type polysaccharide/polyol phosphate export permease